MRMESAPSWLMYIIYGGLGYFAVKFVVDKYFRIPVGIAQVPTKPKRQKPEKRDYTKEELRAFDGNDPDKPILMAVKGKIYDVSPKEEFYGPGGAYHVFAGKDASRGLAKGTTDAADAENPSLDGLGKHELDTLNEWASHYEIRYECIGNLKQ